MSFQATYDRIKQATGLHTQTEIADFLGIRQSSISDAKRRNAIPGLWLITMFDKLAINPSWLRSGEGPQYLTGADGRPPSPSTLDRRAAVCLGPVLRYALLGVIPELAAVLQKEMNLSRQ